MENKSPPARSRACIDRWLTTGSAISLQCPLGSPDGDGRVGLPWCPVDEKPRHWPLGVEKRGYLMISNVIWMSEYVSDCQIAHILWKLDCHYGCFWEFSKSRASLFRTPQDFTNDFNNPDVVSLIQVQVWLWITRITGSFIVSDRHPGLTMWNDMVWYDVVK